MFYRGKISVLKDKFINDAYKRAMDELNSFFDINWIYETPQIIILKNREAINILKHKKTESWFVAWADNSRNVFILDRNNFGKESSHKYSNEYYLSLIKHEIAHLFYKILSKGKTGPNWLSEGVAIFTSGQNKFKEMPKKFKDFLKFYDKLEKETYYESGFVVELLVKNFGKNKLLKLIKSLSEINNEERFYKKFKSIYKFDLSYKHLNKILKKVPTL